MGLRDGFVWLNGVSVDFRPCGFTWLSWFLDWYSSCLDYRIWHLGCLLGGFGGLPWFVVGLDLGCYIGVAVLDWFGCMA